MNRTRNEGIFHLLGTQRAGYPRRYAEPLNVVAESSDAMTLTKTITTAERRELEERIIWELGPSAMCVGKLSSQLGILPEIVSDVVDGLVERRLLVRESGDAEPVYANRFKRVYRLSSRALTFLRQGKDPTDPRDNVTNND